MDETDDTTTTASTTVRKTRSGRAVRPPATPSPAQKTKSPKPAAGRKTRKKVVMVEVEVTDEEENATDTVAEENEEKKEKSSDNTEKVETKTSEEKTTNGNPTPGEDVSGNLVLNDIEMLEEIMHSNEKIAATVSENEKVESAPKVDEPMDTSDSTPKPEEQKPEEIADGDENAEVITENDIANEGSDDDQVEEPPKVVEEVKVTVEEKVQDGGDVEMKEETSELPKPKEVLPEKLNEETPKEKEVVAEAVKAVVVEEQKDAVVKETKVVEEAKNEPKEEEKKTKAVEEEKQSKTLDVEEEKQSETVDIEEETQPKTVEEETQPKTVKEETPPKTADEETQPMIVEEEKPAKAVEEEKKDVKDDIEMKSEAKQNGGDPDAENISEDELPGVPVAKVPETEEVSDEELPEPKRAELPADTEVVSEDELPTTKKESEDELPAKKEGVKRKLSEGDYDPDSPTSENETPSKKVALEPTEKEKEKEEKVVKPKKLPELDKYWKVVNDDPTDFTGWTYLLQYVDQENDMEAAREAYDAFLSHYPYCYGYWRKYADYEKRKGNKKKCEEVFERGLKAIPLSVDLWLHYLTYVKSTRPDDEEYIRSQFERALSACGLEFRSDRLWDSYMKWETENKNLQHVTAIYDRLLATPTQGYTTHFDNFQEHISANPPNKVVEVDEFMALRKEVRNMLKQDAAAVENAAENADIPPGDEEVRISTEEETKCIKERIVSIRRKVHKNTVNAVTARWNFEEGIKRPYFHVKPLERCQLKNWQDYLDYEIEQGEKSRIVVLFERCLIACALYEEFWLKFVHFLENQKDEELLPKIRDVYERACTIHHLKKPNLHLQWAMFEECADNPSRAAEILVNLEKSVPNVLQVAYRRINLERRRDDFEKCGQLYEHYITNSKNKIISSNIAIKYSRFCLKVLKDWNKAHEVLRQAITKDMNNPRLYLQLIDLTLQKDSVTESEICALIDEFLEKESADPDQKVLFAQRKLEYVEDFGADIKSVQAAYDQYQKFIKLSKEVAKKGKETKSDPSSSTKKDKPAQPSSASSQSGSYGQYNYASSSQPSYPYSGSGQGQYGYSGYQGDQYQYQNWQYPQGSYGGYNQWGGYSGGYGY